jgi:hypothetical protein
MRKFHVAVEITIDDERIQDLYPNFDIYYDNVEDFIEHIYDSMETDDPKSLDKLGYRVRVDEHLTMLPITYNAN